jgi:type II secretory ATPase GspE/PulE/Tfp pilus assembly ATPase PilB-like protein
MNVFRPVVIPETPRPTVQTEAPEVVASLIREASNVGASDIHLQAHLHGAAISFRLGGVMTPGPNLTAEVADRVFGRIKFLAQLKTYQDSMPQDGRIEARLVNAPADIRVATYPTVTGEKIVLRLFNNTPGKSVAELGFPDDGATELTTFLREPAGMLLLTGPAGSGKTTTIYACLRALAQPGDRHVITIEDPVEQIVPGVMQTEINEARGLDFAKAARHLLRQDPQALIIGEIRDDETANIAVRAALTGHLVISTLHAGSCKGVLERLIVLCADRSAISASLSLILNQRLMRKLCAECRGNGCAACLQTGYQGRMPVVEWLRLTDDLRARIRNNELHAITPKQSLEESARILVQEGVTNAAEKLRILGL